MTGVNDDGWLTSAPTEPGEVRRFYDEWAEAYDDDLADWDYRAPSRLAGLLVEFGDASDDVLDAGCGTGLSGRAIRAAGCTGVMIGVDVSVPSLERAAAAGVYDEVQQGDLNRELAFDDDRFGLVACVGVLTYVPGIERCWREFARVVRPGGVIACSQRDDIWRERDCDEALGRLVADGVVDVITLSDAEPYLPASDDDMAAIGARYLALRVL